MIIDTTQTKIERGLQQIRGWNNFLKTFDEIIAEIKLERTILAAGEENEMP